MKHKKILIIIAIELAIIAVLYFGFIRGKSDDKKQKAGIRPGEQVSLQRFEVIRHR